MLIFNVFLFPSWKIGSKTNFLEKLHRRYWSINRVSFSTLERIWHCKLLRSYGPCQNWKDWVLYRKSRIWQPWFHGRGQCLAVHSTFGRVRALPSPPDSSDSIKLRHHNLAWKLNYAKNFRLREKNDSFDVSYVRGMHLRDGTSDDASADELAKVRIGGWRWGN